MPLLLNNHSCRSKTKQAVSFGLLLPTLTPLCYIIMTISSLSHLKSQHVVTFRI